MASLSRGACGRLVQRAQPDQPASRAQSTTGHRAFTRLLQAASKPFPALAAVAKVNRSAKGTVIELKAIKILETWGYKVHRCVRTGVKRGPHYFSQSNDVFGCIDLIAKKRGERTRWVQVTADSGIGRKKGDLAEVPWDPLFDQVEIWRWVGGAARKHKTTGEVLDRQYFQVYKFEQGFELLPDNRIRASDEADDAGVPRTPVDSATPAADDAGVPPVPVHSVAAAADDAGAPADEADAPEVAG